MTTSDTRPRGAGDVAVPRLSRTLLFILAFCAGAAVANLYYAQPLLARIAQSLNAPTGIGLVAVATQVGYTLGIVFILPLGDLIERKRLTVSLVGVLVVATLACALSPNLHALAAASLVVGVGATITQIMIPLAADLAEPEARARAVGTVFSGILAGILLARTISGAIGEVLGWRVMFVIASLVAIGLGVVLSRALPRLEPRTSQSYGSLLASMYHLLLAHRPLRIACGIQACQFAIFSAFWTVLSLLLADAPFHLGPAAAGAFGIIGIAGVAAANISGRLIDSYGPRLGLRFGLGCSLAAWLVLSATLSIAGLVIGVLLLDFGMSIANVSNQSTILGLDAQARSRINTIYVTAIFVGGSIGSAFASIAWVHGGWSAVCGFGVIVALAAIVVHLCDTRPVHTGGVAH